MSGNAIGHAWIEAHIPHKGSMCLLDSVVSWGESSIVCRACSHLAADNPLRHGDRLGIANGIEYAAQAMAVHGALLAGSGQTPSVGFLASVRNVRWSRSRLDDIGGELTVCAERLSGNELTILYDFSLLHAETVLMTGRAAVMLDAGKHLSFISREQPS